MKFIAIDLEIEQSFTNPQTPDSQTEVPELIQTGIVVFELNKDEISILESKTFFNRYSKPLSSFIKSLTSIEDSDLKDAFNTAGDMLRYLSCLIKEYDTSRQIVEWGSGDMKFLQEKSQFTDEYMRELGLARSHINVKTLYQAYALANNLKRVGGLSKSMGQLGLSFKSTHYNGRNRGTHWAESDALNTARIYNTLINNIRKEK